MDNGYEEKGKEIKTKKRKGDKLTSPFHETCCEMISLPLIRDNERQNSRGTFVRVSSLRLGSMCILKGFLQASKVDTNTENYCLSLDQATCLLNNSLAVDQWDRTPSPSKTSALTAAFI